MKERISYYDFARGLGIIFVVIGHIDTFYMPFRSVVISFHMALFLLISGMLLSETGEENRPYLQNMKKKFMRIMVPYILFSLIAIAIEFIRLALQGIFFWPHFKVLLTLTITGVGNSSLWFLPALFISEMIFLGIRKTGKDYITLPVVGGLAGFAVWANEQGVSANEWLGNVQTTLIRAIFCTLFLGVGYYVRKWIMSRKIPGVVYVIAGVVFVGICMALNEINPKVDLRAMYWGELFVDTFSNWKMIIARVVVYLVTALTGAMGVIFISKALERFSNRNWHKLLAWAGKNSLIIMATHLDFHVLHYSMDFAVFLDSLKPSSFLYHSYMLIAVFAMEAVLIYVINRFFPVLAGRSRKKIS